MSSPDKIQINSAEIPFVKILLPFGCGILTAYPWSSALVLHMAAMILVSLFAGLCICNLFYLQFKMHRHKRLTGLAVYGIWFTAGFVCCCGNRESIKANYFEGKNYRYLKIRITEDPQYKNQMIRFNAHVISGLKPGTNRKQASGPALTEMAASGKLLIILRLKNPGQFRLKYGDELLINAKITEVRGPQNPGELDYRAWMASQNIYHQAFLEQKDILRLRADRANRLIGFALEIRQRQLEFFRKIFRQDDALAVASALILGYRSDLSRETLDIYINTGTVHALSVSGMHVGLLYLVFNQALGFMERKKWSSVLKTVLILLFIWFYTMLTGLSPSVLRSAVMISVFVISKSLSKRTSSYNVLAFSAFVLLLWNPFFIHDIGFQLSFLAVFGMVWIQPMIGKWFRTENKWLRMVWNAIAVSISAQVLTFPLCIYYFHQFPVYFLLSNLFLMVPATLLMYLGIVILVFKLDLPGPVFEWLIHFTNTVLLKISRLPGATFSGIWLNINELVLMYTAIVLLIFAFSKFNKRLLFFSLSLMICFQFLQLLNLLEARGQRKLIVFKIRESRITGFISGQHITLLTTKKPGDRDFNYFIRPATEKYRIRKIRWILSAQN